ncbi:MAG: YdcF family protein [Clostridiales bacterium]|nr:YdcF family protein [Clostridiales bacterium]
MKKGLKTISIFMALTIIISIILGIDIKLFGKRSKPQNSDCIIVLGCSVYGTDPSPFLRGRLQEAYRLYNEGYSDYIIVSGGQGKGEHISEAEAMRRELNDLGVEDQYIILEDKSTSTYENIKYSIGKMQHMGFSSAIIVSNEFHLRRAYYIAKELMLDASFSGVYLKEHRKSEIKGVVREVPALLATFLRQILKSS